MDTFLNLLKAQSARQDQGLGQPRLAIVTSFDPQTFTARVAVQPENVVSGWLPIATPWVGNGWGFCCPATPGDQVVVIWQEGDSQHGIIIGRLWSASAPTPGAPSGELWLVHRSGAFLKLHNDGSIESTATTWTHHGDMRVTGDVYDRHGSLASLRGHYNAHTHPPDTQSAVPMD